MAVLELHHLSHSSLSAYAVCPRSWRWRYIDRPTVAKSANLIFGSAFHTAIETLIREFCRQPVNIGEVWESLWLSAVRDAGQNGGIAWDGATEESLGSDGLAMLTSPEAEQFFLSFRPLIENGQPVIEKRIELSIPGLPLPVIGYVDAFDSQGIPHDFKTAGRAWTQQKADEEIQPTVYLAALNQSGFPLNKGLLFRHVVFTKPSKSGKVSVQTFTTAKSVGDLFRLFANVLDVWRGIQAESYPCNTQSWKCSPRWCEYFALCQGAG